MLNEDQIERLIENKINRLDKLLMSNEITQSDYDYEVSIVDKWASQQYEHTKEVQPC